jgi:hypothetical protein
MGALSWESLAGKKLYTIQPTSRIVWRLPCVKANRRRMAAEAAACGLDRRLLEPGDMIFGERGA